MKLLLIALFLYIWSTGFIVGKAIVPYADPTLFLFIRVCIAAVLFTGIALYSKARWPPWREVPKHLLAGVLLQGLYLSGCYWAIGGGLPPAVMALIGSLQPLLTAVLAIPILKEIPTAKIWVGLMLGLAGVFLVIQPALGTSAGAAGFTPGILAIAFMAILSITLGTLLQKTSIAAVDIRVSAVLQNIGTMMFTGFFVWVLGEDRWVWSPTLWASLLWAAFVMTGIGTMILVWIIRSGQATRAASLMFLAPPLAGIQAYLLFGDRLQPIQLLGFAVALVGVLACNVQRPFARFQRRRAA
ncbi:DMT family transporter [Pusillimonas noertemannii]|uniref:Putative membrane protein n=1 Tax=Pusillimonas noertemannii TaxID=305977 RepID=A0A2U1CJV4_9BURK|nr:DMT family transporter [Pusillimonas noertemannii]NYT69795.1 DMT family transporter [Pusillimonas noertemannii]PVY61281.1 putative membrane protein [Pusillimonas noertemannii]TFL09098.1 DMT family transporter [Pusillimonas noertemannii]